VKTTESVVIDGYDLLAENERLALPDRTVCGNTLNRGTATISPKGTPHPDYADVKRAHVAQVFPSTLEPESPTIDLSYPTAGMFVGSPAGVYIDLYQAVAQKLVDEHHPVFERTVSLLAEHGLTFRREINTDDYVHFSSPVEGLHTPQELAEMVNRLTGAAFPGKAPFRTFFSNSGAEAGEAAMKMAQLFAYRRFLDRHGAEVLDRVMTDLGIPRDHVYDGATRPSPEPVYRDYPFFVIGCDGAFHGRTLGVLSVTRSKKAQHLGFGKLRWVRHVPFNGSPDDFTALVDDRPITEILDAPAGVAGVVAKGRVPVDLAALFMTEVYQGESGYHIADRSWLAGIHEACAERGILFGADEVQSFGRTGELYAAQHFDVEPDVVWAAKAAVLGITVARADIAEACHLGWHSNTFGSGKFFDVNMAHATFHVLTAERDPLFEGRTYLENSRIKGEYVRMRLAELSTRHSELFPDFSGLGCMWGLTVRHREEILETGWRYGLKLLGCGLPGELSRLRILLLADVLTREVDELVEGLDRVLTEVERAVGI